MPLLSRQYDAFCQAHPVRTFVHDNLTWRYRVAGDGRQGLLLLPGAVGDADAYFALVPRVAGSHRVVALAYPDATRLDQFIDGLKALLAHEALTSVDAVGGSFGGLVAQALVQDAPEIIGRVVLSATGPAKRSRSESNATWARRVTVLPLGLTRLLLRAIVRVTMKKVTEERTFWRRFYFEAIARLPKSSLHSRYALSSDIDRRGPVTPEDVSGWTGEMLILDGDGDAIASRDARRALHALFPRARRHTFTGAGHAIALERPSEWRDAVGSFLTRA